MLAQKGRLAVVFSDSALAYGVNMPFRSCIFCGDMGENLTPLIAQQMQGRAGRRGRLAVGKGGPAWRSP